ncbi:ATP-binding cassette domain-containing protein [Pseudonocardiaceae bacterium YIM PH 21723]|nr:ATP-binding cassette domain-containing protein [Pseudonocardiaceae bacterium YIM PH 21723]
MIQVRSLVKSYGGRRAVDDLEFTARPGQVTGFLGPNGAGKSTTMRIILGLERADSGTATVNGRPYAQLDEPLREVGALLDARCTDLRRSGRDHLRVMALMGGIPVSRADEVLAQVGLETAAGKRTGGYSLGMAQRLGIAVALLGDPHTLVFDEPTNGLDVDGIRWIRDLMRGLAAEGRTVLVSSHLMSEVEDLADEVVVIGQGRLIEQSGIREFIDRASGDRVRVECADPAALAIALRASGAVTEPERPGTLLVNGLSRRQVGEIAVAQRIAVYGLADCLVSLEEAYVRASRNSLEFSTRDQEVPA